MLLTTVEGLHTLFAKVSLPISTPISSALHCTVEWFCIRLMVGDLALMQELQRELSSSPDRGTSLLVAICEKSMDLTCIARRLRENPTATTTSDRAVRVPKMNDDTTLIDDLLGLALEVSAICLGTARWQRFYLQLPNDISAHGDSAGLARFLSAVEIISRRVLLSVSTLFAKRASD